MGRSKVLDYPNLTRSARYRKRRVDNGMCGRCGQRPICAGSTCQCESCKEQSTHRPSPWNKENYKRRKREDLRWQQNLKKVGGAI